MRVTVCEMAAGRVNRLIERETHRTEREVARLAREVSRRVARMNEMERLMLVQKIQNFNDAEALEKLCSIDVNDRKVELLG